MHEKISALLDDELDGHEQEDVLKLISQDEGLSATWQRYHLIGAVVRRESILHVPDVSENLPASVLSDDHHSFAAQSGTITSRTWITGLAVAASVAGLVAIGFLSVQPVQSPLPTDANAEIAQVDQTTKWETSTPELESTLNAFLVEHGEFTPVPSMNGLMAYAKFVSYDSTE